LLIVQPDTVVRSHRQGFKLYWRRKSRAGKVRRPKIEAEIRKLIHRTSSDNPLWGTLRIQSQLGLLGYIVAESTVDCIIAIVEPLERYLSPRVVLALNVSTLLRPSRIVSRGPERRRLLWFRSQIIRWRSRLITSRRAG